MSPWDDLKAEARRRGRWGPRYPDPERSVARAELRNNYRAAKSRPAVAGAA
jgi:hypothetical protein